MIDEAATQTRNAKIPEKGGSKINKCIANVIAMIAGKAANKLNQARLLQSLYCFQEEVIRHALANGQKNWLDGAGFILLNRLVYARLIGSCIGSVFAVRSSFCQKFGSMPIHGVCSETMRRIPPAAAARGTPPVPPSK